MKNLIMIAACVLSFACANQEHAQGASVTTVQKTSMQYLAEGSKYYMEGDYKGAIVPYQKALDLEKQDRKLERKFWIVLIDNLGMAYGITGDIKSSFAVFEY